MSGFSSIVGLARVGAARLNAGADHLVCQVGPRLLPARVGFARVGTSRVGQTTTLTNLRQPRWGDGTELTMEDNGQNDPPTCEFDIIVPRTAKPVAGDLVVIGIGTLRNRVYGGRLATVTEGEAIGASYSYTCRAEGFGKKLARTIIFTSYASQLAGDIIQALFAAYATEYGTATRDIADGPRMLAMNFDGLSLADACQELADRCGYQFYVDHWQRVHFAATSHIPAGWAVRETTEHLSDLILTEDTAELKNQVIVRYTELETRREVFTGDGLTTEFRVSAPMYAVTGITVNNVAVTYGLKYQCC